MIHKVLFLIVISAITCVVGCDLQSSEEFSPLAGDEDLLKAACRGNVVIEKEIPFIQGGSNPVYPFPLAQVSGAVGFINEQSPVRGGDAVSVTLSLDATLFTVNGTEPVWSFHHTSTELIQTSAAEPALFLRSYGSGSPDMSVTLYIQYELGNCTLAIHDMWAVRHPPALPLPVTE